MTVAPPASSAASSSPAHPSGPAATPVRTPPLSPAYPSYASSEPRSPPNPPTDERSHTHSQNIHSSFPAAHYRNKVLKPYCNPPVHPQTSGETLPIATNS